MRSTSSIDAYTIILAGQESDNNRSAMQILRLDDIRTEGIYNGEKALRRQRQIDDVILLVDMELPDMAVSKFISRARDLRRSVPIIVIVPEMSKQYTWELAKLGVNEFIPRDQDFLEMLPDVVHNILPGGGDLYIPSDNSVNKDNQADEQTEDRPVRKTFRPKDFTISSKSKPFTSQKNLLGPDHMAEPEIDQGLDMVENERSSIDPGKVVHEVKTNEPMEDINEPGIAGKQTVEKPNRVTSKNDIEPNRSTGENALENDRSDDHGRTKIEHISGKGTDQQDQSMKYDEFPLGSHEDQDIIKVIFENAEDGMIFLDMAGRIIDLNSTALSMFAEKADDVIGTVFTELDIFRKWDLQKLAAIFNEAISRETYSKEIIIQNRHGRSFHLDCTTFRIREEGHDQGLLVIAHEIRKSTEDALKDSENKYRIVSSLTSDYAYAFRIEPNGGLINEWVTGAFNTITGFTVEELQALGGWSSLVYPEDIDIPMKQLGMVLKGRPQRCEYRILTKSGEIRWMKDFAQPIWDENHQRVTHIYGAVQDITAMKMAEGRINSQLRELDLLAATAIELVELEADIDLYDFIKNKLAMIIDRAIIVVSALGRNQDTVQIKAIHGIGKHTGSILKLLHKDPVGMKFNAVDGTTYGLNKGGLVKLPSNLNKLSSGKIPVSVGKAISKLMGIGDIHSIDLTRKGEIFGNVTIIMKKGQKLEKIEVIETFVRQASVAIQRKMAEDKLKASLKEKNILLKEVHHRVKNNLQIVSSLLNLQSSYIDDVKIREVFKESHNRIRSMALVHERLYQTGNFAHLDFDKYLSLLTKNLYRSYVIDPRKIDLEIDIDDISMELNHAIHCGLIITELMSNSLKYAFPVDRQSKGIIRVSLKRTDKEGEITLTISDNGIGIPGSVNTEDSDSLGLHLVRILAEDQLGGRITINTEGGTTFTITFNQEEV